MYCNHCGKQMDQTARFCASCGAAVTTASSVPGFESGTTRQMVRPRAGRMIAGVCAAFAERYGWDVALVRVLLVLTVVFAGTGLFFYLAAWIIIPDGQYALTYPTGTPTS